MTSIPQNEGRRLFGLNASAYEEARPPYPSWMFDALVRQNALFPGANILEIGAGNGLATRNLVEIDIASITVVEPDERFAPLLQSILKQSIGTYELLHNPFEQTQLAASAFDLVVIATAYHWLDAETRVQTLARLVKPGGHVALLWNVFQDLNRVDLFHEATNDLLARLSCGPSETSERLPFALDRVAREAEFLQQGTFELVMYGESHWPLELNLEQLRNLYQSFSNLARLDEHERNRILDELVDVGRTQFAGSVTRHMTSPLYLFRRK